MKPDNRLQHGGRLKEIASASSIALEDWLDVSTGISPWSWPVPPTPESVWRELPNDRDELESIAQSYYQETSLPLAIPGSQWLIRHLPKQLSNSETVAIPLRGYQEHHKSWALSESPIEFYSHHDDLIEKLRCNSAINTVVLINPNNPTGEFYSHEQCKNIADICSARGGLLIIDQAFADSRVGYTVEDNTLIDRSFDPQANVIRSYSLGKFFGLAGLRLGFVFGPSHLIDSLRSLCEPWAVNGPARHIAKQCLNDLHWHSRQKERIKQGNQALYSILQQAKEKLETQNKVMHLHNGGLFISLSGEHSTIESLHQKLLQDGIYCRVFTPIDNRNMLRFGLAKEKDLQRLSTCLALILQSLEER